VEVAQEVHKLVYQEFLVQMDQILSFLRSHHWAAVEVEFNLIHYLTEAEPMAAPVEVQQLMQLLLPLVPLVPEQQVKEIMVGKPHNPHSMARAVEAVQPQ
jgi:hypothetical protein